MSAAASSPVQPFVDRLADRILASWRAHEVRRTAFAGVAGAALREMPPHEALSHEALAEAAVLSHKLPFRQYAESDVGEAATTLYWHPAFFIEALHWHASTPTIHNHAFHGAFALVEGASLHTTYTFHCTEGISDSLLIGEMAVAGTELLKPGDVREIRPRTALIHSVFHVASPSVTVLVRTPAEPGRSDRAEYLPPVGYDATAEHEGVTRRMEMLAFLGRMGSPQYRALACALVRTEDLATTYLVLKQAALTLRVDKLTLSELFGEVEAFWGSTRVEQLKEAIAVHRRQQLVMQAETRVSGSSERTVLGLLIGPRTWRDLASALRLLTPEAPAVDLMAALLVELKRHGLVAIKVDETCRQVLSWLLDSAEPAARSLAHWKAPERSCHERLAQEPLLSGLFGKADVTPGRRPRRVAPVG